MDPALTLEEIALFSRLIADTADRDLDADILVYLGRIVETPVPHGYDADERTFLGEEGLISLRRWRMMGADPSKKSFRGWDANDVPPITSSLEAAIMLVETILSVQQKEFERGSYTWGVERLFGGSARAHLSRSGGDLSIWKRAASPAKALVLVLLYCVVAIREKK